MKAMILAAGEGTRLRPLTLDRPKPMVPIDGRPLLEHTIGWLRGHGVTEIAINLHYRPDAVIDYFRDGTAFGVELRYSLEETLLGTAGGVRRLADYFDEPFVLVYGDVLTDANLGDLLDFHHRRPERPWLTLGVSRVPNPTECGIVSLDRNGRIARFVEKPAAEVVFSNLASAGILVVDPAVLSAIPDRVFCDFGHHVFPQLLSAGRPMYGWLLPEDAYLVDIGAPEKYAQAQREWPMRRAQSVEH